MSDAEHMYSIATNDGMDSEEADTIWQALELQSGLEPPGRCGHAAISCNDGKRLVIIGGYNAEGFLDDVWALDLEQREWRQLDIAGPSPPARAFFRGCSGPPLAGDSRENSTFAYLFGGSDIEGDATNEVWCLDVDGMAWIKVHGGGSSAAEGPIAAPSPRTNHAMCRIGNFVAVHGGESSSGELLDDLWLFNAGTASWHEVRTCRSGRHPCARSSHCLAFADAGGRKFHSSVQQPSELTSVMSQHALNGSLVVFGGLGLDDGGTDVDSSGAEEESMPLNDLWVLRLGSNVALGFMTGREEGVMALEASDIHEMPTWSLIVLNGVGPSPRSLSALAVRQRRRPPALSEEDNAPDEDEHRAVELFLFGGYGLVELPSERSFGDGGDSDEGGDIIMAYIDDLWGLSMEFGSTVAGSVEDGDREERKSNCSEAGAHVVKDLAPFGEGWVDEQGMGFACPSPVEGRNGHTLTWCAENLVLFGGFIGDGFDAGVHVAKAPSLTALE